MPGDVGAVVCTEIAVVSLTLRTRWMSPGGANALTSPLMTVSADEPPGLHVALAFYVDEPYRLRDEVVAQELPGRTRDLDLV
jgi:hypothetical protein